MATHRIPIIGHATKPDDTGDCTQQSFAEIATNGVWDFLVWVFGSTTVRHGFYGTFTVPENYVAGAKIVVSWSTDQTTGTVEWDFDYRAVGGDDTESLDQTGTQETVNVGDVAPSAIWERMNVDLSLTDGNFNPGDTVEFYMVRDGTDGGDNLGGVGGVLFTLEFVYTD